jgi:hypothetical protein
MQSCPERLGRDVHIGAEWRHDGRKGLEGCVQFRPRVRLGRCLQKGAVRRNAEANGKPPELFPVLRSMRSRIARARGAVGPGSNATIDRSAALS